MRLDSYLVENGFAKSRERAKEHIKNGDVSIDGKIISKPAYEVSESENVVFSGERLKYVGRGGLKLEKALSCFGIDLSGKTCIDIGASTGGFTDCMLKHGAAFVYAVDVGHGQLDPSLAGDERVSNMEGVNITDVPAGVFEKAPDFISADVSFVSMKKIFPVIAELLGGKGEAAVLIKPQFEAGRADVGKNGIVKDKKVHIRVLNEICTFCSGTDLRVIALDYSPITGGDGNIEYLAHIIPAKNAPEASGINTDLLVETAFGRLK